MELDKIYNENCLEGMKRIPDGSVDCVVTSPPYYALRDYGVDGQIGLEPSPEEYIARLCDVFREVLRVMKPTATCWVVIGDSYNCYRGARTRTHYDTKWAGESGHPARPSGYGLECKELKDKDLIGIPWMLAFALRDMGFFLRQDIIWHKPNPMPESVKCRCTKSHEYVFMLTKSARYYFDSEALREPANTGVRKNEYNHRKVKFVVPGHRQEQFRGGNQSDGKRNKRDVWSVLVKPGYEGHHATFPVELPLECISLGCPQDGTVLDPFMGTATTAVAAMMLHRHYVGFELNKEYYDIALKRIEEHNNKKE
jgi:DNA modification methylase